MFAVVLKSLCPSHSWICFIGTPLASRRLAQLCRRSCSRMTRIDAQFGVATAMGLFKSVVSTIFISVSYFAAYKFANYRIF